MSRRNEAKIHHTCTTCKQRPASHNELIATNRTTATTSTNVTQLEPTFLELGLDAALWLCVIFLDAGLLQHVSRTADDPPPQLHSTTQAEACSNGHFRAVLQCKCVHSLVLRPIILTFSQDAVDALNALQTPYSIVEARRKAGIRPNEKSMREMRAYLARLGYSVNILLTFSHPICVSFFSR